MARFLRDLLHPGILLAAAVTMILDPIFNVIGGAKTARQKAPAAAKPVQQPIEGA